VADYAAALRNGSLHLELDPPRTMDDALAFLLAMYPQMASTGAGPIYLGDLDALLEPFAGQLDPGAGEGLLDARLRRFWWTLQAVLPDVPMYAGLGPADGRVVRAVLRVQRDLRPELVHLTLRVDPTGTPDDLLAEAVRTGCADRRPHFVNHPMLVTDLGPDYGVVGGDASLPNGGGCYTQVTLDLAESVRRHDGPHAMFLADTLVRDVALTAELMGARIRLLVEQAEFFEQDWLVREGLIARPRFTALLGVVGLAEAVDELMAREHAWGADGGNARYGRDGRANALAHRMIQRLSELVEAIGMPYCEATGGHALLYAPSAVRTGATATAGARIPADHEPGLYRHIRTVAPHHRYFPAGISDLVRFESTVAVNPAAVVAVVRGAFAAGMREFSFETVGKDLRVGWGAGRGSDVSPAPDGAQPPNAGPVASTTGRWVDLRAPVVADD
jgi:YjjI family glycine radical enzyme